MYSWVCSESFYCSFWFRLSSTLELDFDTPAGASPFPKTAWADRGCSDVSFTTAITAHQSNGHQSGCNRIGLRKYSASGLLRGAQFASSTSTRFRLFGKFRPMFQNENVPAHRYFSTQEFCTPLRITQSQCNIFGVTYGKQCNSENILFCRFQVIEREIVGDSKNISDP